VTDSEAAGASLGPLRLLAVDDEPAALADLVWMLGRDPRVGEVRTAEDGAAALRALHEDEFDAVFLDIQMPGLDGLDLARMLARFAVPPPVVFVTAYDDFAVEAFDLQAVDYVLKPVRAERLAEALRRVITPPPPASHLSHDDDETLAVELGGITRFVRRSQVLYVEAHGDYARLHTSHGSHLVRVSLATLEERWTRAGFVRTHRRFLVAAAHVSALHVDGGHCSVVLDSGATLPVARRHTKDVRARLCRAPTLAPSP